HTPVVSVEDFIVRILAKQQEEKRWRVLGIIWVFGAWLVHSSQSVMCVMVKCEDICWCKSGLEKLKCNVDGAIFTDNGCMGWAVVLRNDE
ncbi:hypothetical protein Golob_026478, partial [Gossypium lobatum]|nr:hypothetical protein [Gossypium lobatum]